MSFSSYLGIFIACGSLVVMWHRFFSQSFPSSPQTDVVLIDVDRTTATGYRQSIPTAVLVQNPTEKPGIEKSGISPARHEVRSDGSITRPSEGLVPSSLVPLGPPAQPAPSPTRESSGVPLRPHRWSHPVGSGLPPAHLQPFLASRSLADSTVSRGSAQQPLLRVYIVQGDLADGLTSFYFDPIVRTLKAGFERAQRSFNVTWHRFLNPEDITAFAKQVTAGEIFLWVGMYLLTSVPWGLLKARGVYCVYYQTEFVVGGFFREKNVRFSSRGKNGLWSCGGARAGR